MFNISKRNIRLAISASCNFHCVYCDGHRERKPNKPGAMEDFRRTPVSSGIITTKDYIKIIKALHLAGFDGLTLTGGEPFLNPDWDVIVSEAKKMGMKRVGVTTNGMLLSNYLKKKGHMPRGLTLLTLSLDTTDPKRFKKITRYGDLAVVINGLKEAKGDNPELIIRANKVLMRSDKKNLLNYIDFCHQLGVIDEINLLNLILKELKNKKFFEKEYISTQEVIKLLSKQMKYPFKMDDRYEFRAKLKGGMEVIVKDTNLTMRNKQCIQCPIYCQEGFYTVRVATDGTINLCPDYNAKLPYLDGKAAIEKKNLNSEVAKLIKVFDEVRLEKTLRKFFRKYQIEIDY